MARISTYANTPSDQLEGDDKIIGTNSNQGNGTMNFTLDELGGFYSRTGAAEASLTFTFDVGDSYVPGGLPSDGIESGHAYFNSDTFADVTEMIIAPTTNRGVDTTAFAHSSTGTESIAINQIGSSLNEHYGFLDVSSHGDILDADDNIIGFRIRMTQHAAGSSTVDLPDEFVAITLLGLTSSTNTFDFEVNNTQLLSANFADSSTLRWEVSGTTVTAQFDASGVDVTADDVLETSTRVFVSPDQRDQIGQNEIQIGTNTTNIATNTSEIGMLETSVSTNTSNISINSTDILALENAVTLEDLSAAGSTGNSGMIPKVNASGNWELAADEEGTGGGQSVTLAQDQGAGVDPLSFGNLTDVLIGDSQESIEFTGSDGNSVVVPIGQGGTGTNVDLVSDGGDGILGVNPTTLLSDDTSFGTLTDVFIGHDDEFIQFFGSGGNDISVPIPIVDNSITNTDQTNPVEGGAIFDALADKVNLVNLDAASTYTPSRGDLVELGTLLLVAINDGTAIALTGNLLTDQVALRNSDDLIELFELAVTTGNGAAGFTITRPGLAQQQFTVALFDALPTFVADDASSTVSTVSTITFPDADTMVFTGTNALTRTFTAGGGGTSSFPIDIATFTYDPLAAGIFPASGPVIGSGYSVTFDPPSNGVITFEPGQVLRFNVDGSNGQYIIGEVTSYTSNTRVVQLEAIAHTIPSNLVDTNTFTVSPNTVGPYVAVTNEEGYVTAGDLGNLNVINVNENISLSQAENTPWAVSGTTTIIFEPQTANDLAAGLTADVDKFLGVIGNPATGATSTVQATLTFGGDANSVTIPTGTTVTISSNTLVLSGEHNFTTTNPGRGDDIQISTAITGSGTFQAGSNIELTVEGEVITIASTEADIETGTSLPTTGFHEDLFILQVGSNSNRPGTYYFRATNPTTAPTIGAWIPVSFTIPEVTTLSATDNVTGDYVSLIGAGYTDTAGLVGAANAYYAPGLYARNALTAGSNAVIWDQIAAKSRVDGVVTDSVNYTSIAPNGTLLGVAWELQDDGSFSGVVNATDVFPFNVDTVIDGLRFLPTSTSGLINDSSGGEFFAIVNDQVNTTVLRIETPENGALPQLTAGAYRFYVTDPAGTNTFEFTATLDAGGIGTLTTVTNPDQRDYTFDLRTGVSPNFGIIERELRARTSSANPNGQIVGFTRAQFTFSEADATQRYTIVGASGGEAILAQTSTGTLDNDFAKIGQLNLKADTTALAEFVDSNDVQQDLQTITFTDDTTMVLTGATGTRTFTGGGGTGGVGAGRYDLETSGTHEFYEPTAAYAASSTGVTNNGIVDSVFGSESLGNIEADTDKWRGAVVRLFDSTIVDISTDTVQASNNQIYAETRSDATTTDNPNGYTGYFILAGLSAAQRAIFTDTDTNTSDGQVRLMMHNISIEAQFVAAVSVNQTVNGDGTGGALDSADGTSRVRVQIINQVSDNFIRVYPKSTANFVPGFRLAVPTVELTTGNIQTGRLIDVANITNRVESINFIEIETTATVDFQQWEESAAGTSIGFASGADRTTFIGLIDSNADNVIDTELTFSTAINGDISSITLPLGAAFSLVGTLNIFFSGADQQYAFPDGNITVGTGTHTATYPTMERESGPVNGPIDFVGFEFQTVGERQIVTNQAITGAQGDPGAQGAQGRFEIDLYQRSATAVTAAPASVLTWDFDDNAFVSAAFPDANGWQDTVPSGSDQLYIVRYILDPSSPDDTTENRETILTTDWSAPFEGGGQGPAGTPAGFGAPTAAAVAPIDSTTLGIPTVEADPASPDTAKIFNFGIPTGLTGAAAGFGTPTTRSLAHGQAPSVTADAASPDTAKIFDFAIPEGEPGVYVYTGAEDPTAFSFPSDNMPVDGDLFVETDANDVTTLYGPFDSAAATPALQWDVAGATVLTGVSDELTVARVADGVSVTSSLTSTTATVADGQAGESAFELWQAVPNAGTVDDFLASLIGAAGTPAPSQFDAGTSLTNITLLEGSSFSSPFTLPVIAEHRVQFTFTVEAGLGWAENQVLRVSPELGGNPIAESYFDMIVTSYTGTTLVGIFDNRVARPNPDASDGNGVTEFTAGTTLFTITPSGAAGGAGMDGVNGTNGITPIVGLSASEVDGNDVLQFTQTVNSNTTNVGTPITIVNGTDGQDGDIFSVDIDQSGGSSLDPQNIFRRINHDFTPAQGGGLISNQSYRVPLGTAYVGTETVIVSYNAENFFVGTVRNVTDNVSQGYTNLNIQLGDLTFADRVGGTSGRDLWQLQETDGTTDSSDFNDYSTTVLTADDDPDTGGAWRIALHDPAVAPGTGITNLGIGTQTDTTLQITSSTGTNVTLPVANSTSSEAGLLSGTTAGNIAAVGTGTANQFLRGDGSNQPLTGVINLADGLSYNDTTHTLSGDEATLIFESIGTDIIIGTTSDLQFDSLGGDSTTLTYSLANTTVVPDTYAAANLTSFTVDAKGRLTGVVESTPHTRVFTGDLTATPSSAESDPTNGNDFVINFTNVNEGFTYQITNVEVDGSNFTRGAIPNSPNNSVTITNTTGAVGSVGVHVTYTTTDTTATPNTVRTGNLANTTVTVTAVPVAPTQSDLLYTGNVGVITVNPTGLDVNAQYDAGTVSFQTGANPRADAVEHTIVADMDYLLDYTLTDPEIQLSTVAIPAAESPVFHEVIGNRRQRYSVVDQSNDSPTTLNGVSYNLYVFAHNADLTLQIEI